jgi:hypothetical protein
VFTSFAIQDQNLRDLLVGQRLHTGTPFEFTDMSVKQAWDEQWRTRCRSRIKGCDGVIGIITPNTPSATGQLWELQSAYEESKPVLLIHGYSEKRAATTPPEIKGRMINVWTWDRVGDFIKSL